jgi:hypothetical protein
MPWQGWVPLKALGNISFLSGPWCFMPVILVIWKAEIEKMEV